MRERPDYIIRSGGGSIVEPGTVTPEAEASLAAWLDKMVSRDIDPIRTN